MNIQREIKRKIYAKKHPFFIIVPLGLEKIASEELTSFKIEHEIKKGGLLVNEKLDKLYELNIRTRVATRILMRISTFKARFKSNLRKGISDINWQLFLKKGCKISFVVSSKKSKLIHTGLITEVLTKEILKYSELNNLDYLVVKDKESQKIYLRLEDDKATISIDSSGEILHKRGYKKYSSTAPIRENLAAAILLKYWDKNLTLLDPMTGSGTFSLEAYLIKKNIAPGINRNFAFMNWSNFKEKSFNYLKRNLINEELDESVDIESSDISKETIEKAILNFKDFKKLDKPVVKDFFNITTDKKSGLIVLNLPYGKRITKNRTFYKKISDKLIKDFKGWNVLLLYPRDVTFPLKGEIMKISNGGFLINLLFLKI